MSACVCVRPTFLGLEELFELVGLVLDRLLLDVRADLLQGEVGHVHLHDIQHAEYLPATCHDTRVSPAE